MLPNDQSLYERAVKIMNVFDLPLSVYEEFCLIMDNNMLMGLQNSTNKSASVKMYPTYVSKIPNGSERGKFLALDLGGTNYRVLLINFKGKKIPPDITERNYAIPREKMEGSAEALFAFIATTLSDFLKTYDLENESFNLGFTFSFPCEQKGLTNAVLVQWTKGFSATGAVGNNVALLLQKAIDATGINVKCVAVVNDTVGTLASCALVDARCAIGLIVGTGTNAAYIEKSENVETITDHDGPTVVINMEWGALGNNGELEKLRTQFDRQLDAESLYPNQQIFEKLVSGMYLGELVRLLLVHLVKQKLLFHGVMPEKLMIKNAVLTKYLTEAERDPSHLCYSTHYVLCEELEVPEVEPLDDWIVRYACEIVSKRAAYLVGAGIAAILRRMKKSNVTIGIDGSLYKFHPKFRERMTDVIDKLKPKNCNFRLCMSEDGSGKGAAAIAAAAIRRED